MSDSDSTLTSTGTFSSTIPGIGSLSGKAIKRLGSAVVNGVDALLIRRRLGQIEDALGQRPDGTPDPCDVKAYYNDLLELAHPFYSLSIRTRAFRVIMGKIAGLDFIHLADALVNWPSDSTDLIRDMILCLGSSSNDLEANIMHVGGLDAYKTRLPYGSSSGSTLCIAYLLFMALLISLSEGPGLSRTMMELGILPFITGNYPSILELKTDQWNQLLPVQLVLHALLEKLDPVDDAGSVTQIQGLLDLPSLERNFQQPTSRISYLVNVPLIGLLAQKLRNIPLVMSYFPEENEPVDKSYHIGCAGTIARFLAPSLCSDEGRDIRVHATSVIDEDQIENAINEIYDTYLFSSALPSVPLLVHISVDIEHD